MFDRLPVTQALIIANVLVFLLEVTFGGAGLAWFALWPIGPQFRPWQLLTYAFLHGGWWHLLLNMLGLYVFGSDLERVWGPRRYTLYYLVCVVSAVLSQLAFAAATSSDYPTIGASGGVFGLLLAFALYFPHRTIVLLFPPIPMPAWLFATLYGFIELASGVTGLAGNVAHFGHLVRPPGRNGRRLPADPLLALRPAPPLPDRDERRDAIDAGVRQPARLRRCGCSPSWSGSMRREDARAR